MKKLRVTALLLVSALLASLWPCTQAAYQIEDTRFSAGQAAVYRSYYSALSPIAQVIYNALVENIEKTKDGSGEITFPFPAGTSLGDVDAKLYQDAMIAFNRDHNEVFWLDMSKMALRIYQSGANTVMGKLRPTEGSYYTSAYSSLEQVERDIGIMETRIQELVSAAISLDTLYERLLYVHDWLVMNNACGDNGLQSGMRCFEAVCALEGNTQGDDRPVCEAYARAFKLLCDELGVPCLLITGTGYSGGEIEPHMWNYVLLDGQWYVVDVTWDDPYNLEPTKEPIHTYFLTGSNTKDTAGASFRETHVEELKRYHSSTKMVFPPIAGEIYVYREVQLSGGFDAFVKSQTYKDGLFKDVKSGQWYEESVSGAYALGLMKGIGGGAFGVSNRVTIAETIVLAARIHAAYYGIVIPEGGENWYASSVDYAFSHNIIRRRYPDYLKQATRAGFVEILSAALPREALLPCNGVPEGAIKDISADAPYASAAYLFFRAGVVIGNDRGNFRPDTHITRGEVAAILLRMVNPAARVQIN